jgi:Chaperone of endosialidase
MNPLIQLTYKTSIVVITLLLACFAMRPAPNAFGVVPPPDGGYPNFTTAEGTKALQNLTTGAANTGIGWYSLFSASTASYNTGIGAGTLALNTADGNTATGTAALLLNSTGTANTANGAFALLQNDTGSSNTATGFSALQVNTVGGFNTAIGSFALAANVNGTNNTAVGAGALENSTTTGNTAIGSSALLFNTTGSANTATGFQALKNNNNGISNTATGSEALSSNVNGGQNVATGLGALISNTGGNENVAVGYLTLSDNTTGGFNVAIGADALLHNTGSDNIAVGFGAGSSLTTGDDNIDIGNDGFNGESATIRIGHQGTQTATFIAGIHGATVANGVSVIIGTDGHLGTIVSSQRFKDKIKPMDKASEAILALKPVTFRYKSDGTNTPQFGLIAEEVASVNPDLVVRDENGEIYSVRYDAVNAMLLNEFLKEHRKVEQQRIDFEAALAQRQKQIEALTAGLQKVSAQLATASPSEGGLDLSKAAPQTVLNNW